MPETLRIHLDDEAPDTERAPRTTLGARAALDCVLDALGGDEIAVLVRIAERLKEGATTYGPLRLAVDVRSFRSKEAREELEDALVYLACAWLKAETGRSAHE